MASRDDRARIRILEAYERAKAVNPGMTQADFMMQGAPGAHIEGLPGNFKSKEAASRYFRKIRSGERTGGAMYRAGREKGTIGTFQAQFKVGDKYVSQNLLVAGGESTFDIPAIEYELNTGRQKASMQRSFARLRARYGMEEQSFRSGSIRVRTVKNMQRHATMHFTIE